MVQYLDGIFVLLEDVKLIVDQINLLVFNVVIEVVCVGEVGCGFVVVVDEVCNFFEWFIIFNEQICKLVYSFKDVIVKVCEMVLYMVLCDMDWFCEVCYEVVQMLDNVVQINVLFGDGMCEIFECGCVIDSSVVEVVCVLQFEDIVIQVLGGVYIYLDCLIVINWEVVVLQELLYCNGGVFDEEVVIVLQCIGSCLCEMCSEWECLLYKVVVQQSMVVGVVELF